MNSIINFGYIANILPSLLKTVPFTLLVIAVSGVFAFLLGVIVTAVRIKRTQALFQLAMVYVSFVRSTPAIVQLFVVFYGSPLLFIPFGIDINTWSRTVFAVITLILHYGVFFSEILRPAYLAVDKGQHEAADSIGMTGMQKLFRIVGPQVVPIALPGLGNTVIELIKDTSILFTIGVVDLMGGAKIIIASDYGIGQLEVYITIALIYWLISGLSEKAINTLERKSMKTKGERTHV